MVPQLPPLNYDVLQHSSDGNSTAAAPYKEYETQVLAMTVQDDANGNRAGMIGMSREFHMDTSTQRNHFLDLDKVDYISRDGHSSKAESLVDASIEDEFDSDSLPLPPRGSHRHPPNSVTTSQAYVHQEADVSKHYSQAEEVRNRKHAARRENLLRESLVYPGYDDFPPAGIGQRNPLYESGTFPSVSSETGTPDGSLNVCATNENIIFKQKKIQGEVEL
ncbi:unnamed protein product [Cyprideis torosa]|uniref:Uncharacterized protein n=1 Tax=Cyprideis torosa TaxID=163714 RepID=A0A7R8WH69_9CRUS|nr:unnamed protein product [Cyprideis torosa]CAG0899040.1 unnamed protein product [Cyprideis torosa]